MGMVCHGVCGRHRVKTRTYINGAKRCMVCGIFVNWDGQYCPCCGMRLRSRPHLTIKRKRYYNLVSSMKAEPVRY